MSCGPRGPSAHPVDVAGAMGPLGIRIEPYGPTGLDEARDQAQKDQIAD